MTDNPEETSPPEARIPEPGSPATPAPTMPPAATEATTPEAPEPEAPAPDVVEPEAPEPDVVEPEAPQPEAVQPAGALEDPESATGPTPMTVPTPAEVASVVQTHPTPPAQVEAPADPEAPEPAPAHTADPGTAVAPVESAEATEEPETSVAPADATEEPEPVPGPTPMTVPTPAVVASVVHEHPTPPAPTEGADLATDHTTWGRVDEIGTVWVRTSTGERSVGSYPGATPDEALAYFARKFEEVEGQISLLEQRVAASGVSPKDAETSITNLRESITVAHAVGDLDALSARLDRLVGQVAEHRQKADAARAAARRESQVVKERIVAEAESLQASTDWKRTGDRLRGLLDEWKAAARLERKADDALWKRFSHARTAFDKSRRAHFAELDTQRASAAEAKEKLIAEAKELSTSTDWGPTARRYRDLMTQWKATGRARRDVEDEMWARFRAAQDTFFAARGEVFSARDADLAVNLEKKQALLVDAEKLVPVTDVRAARNALRSIHDRWEAAGHVPRGDKDAVEGRLRKVDEAVRGADDSEWKRSNPEARARAEATVSQLQTSIESLDAEAAAADEAGQLDKANKAKEAAAARREWLAEAERTLAEFS